MIFELYHSHSITMNPDVKNLLDVKLEFDQGWSEVYIGKYNLILGAFCTESNLG